MTKYGIVGNREGYDYSYVLSQLKKVIKQDDIIISGGAKGVDSIAHEFARENGHTIIVHYPKPFEPVPERYFNRNTQIATECDVLIYFDKKSSDGYSGTKNTVNTATKLGKKVINGDLI